ncbi:IS66-like element accessory protein TnpA [Ralstonia pseudosolanacearum]|uniref:IS66-like element accessory protein TnpA n=1 Tax=Ralstonia pseudosolanacearum TaxID=1310165 RepID=UPI003C30E4E1
MLETDSKEAGVARRRHRNYSLEFKQEVVQLSMQPGISVAQAARKYDLNDNLVFEWRRQHRLGKFGVPAQETQSELVPVCVVDALEPAAAPPSPQAAATESRDAVGGCDVEIEIGKRRVRIRGLSMDRAERFLRECLQ